MISYLQKRHARSGERAVESRQVEISTISSQLKALAKELSVPVLALAQLNRAAPEGREDRRPLLSAGQQHLELVRLQSPRMASLPIGWPEPKFPRRQPLLAEPEALAVVGGDDEYADRQEAKPSHCDHGNLRPQWNRKALEGCTTMVLDDYSPPLHSLGGTTADSYRLRSVSEHLHFKFVWSSHCLLTELSQ